MQCAPFSKLGGPGGTGYGGVRFPVHDGLNNRDVSLVDMCDHDKECVSFLM